MDFDIRIDRDHFHLVEIRPIKITKVVYTFFNTVTQKGHKFVKIWVTTVLKLCNLECLFISQWARIFKKVQAKKLVKCNKSKKNS